MEQFYFSFFIFLFLNKTCMSTAAVLGCLQVWGFGASVAETSMTLLLLLLSK